MRKIDEHASAADPASAAGAPRNSSICGLLHRRRTPRLASSRVQAPRRSTRPPMHRPPSAMLRSGNLVTRRAAMKTHVVRLVATLALALAATTVALAQSRPPACIPQYDASGAQVAPYCGP